VTGAAGAAGAAGAGFGVGGLGPGRGPGAAGEAAGFSAAGCSAAAGLGAGGLGAAGPGRAACAGEGDAEPEGAGGLGAACLRGAPGLAAAGLPLPPPWFNASVNLRTTGASIVEDAERTNSPSSWSLAMTTLLSTPNSLASSYTRTLATSLLLGPGYAGPSLLHGRTHRVLIECSSQSRPTSNSRNTRAARGSARPSLRCCLLGNCLDDSAQVRRVERARGLEGPRERSASDRQVETDRNGVDVRTPAGQRTAWIGGASALFRHDAQQIALGRSLPAPHTGAFRACSGLRPARHD
jgi:hypothetical protein